MLNFIATLGTAVALATTPVAIALKQAAAPTPAVSTPAATGSVTSASERKRLLAAAAKSLETAKTARGKFEQIASDDSVSTGWFALSRPGKVRFDYDDPVPLLLVSDGATVALQDSELETTDRVPLSATPLSVLLSAKLDFENDADIVDVRKTNGVIEIEMADPSGEMDGTLTLLMSETGQELVGWRTVDSSLNTTTVRLEKVEYGKKLNPRMFIVTEFDSE